MAIDDSSIIAELSVHKIEPGHYTFAMSHGGEVLYEDAGFTSIEEAISSANNQEGPICGFEIAYQGVVIGTYLCEELEHVVEEVVRRAVYLLAIIAGER